MNWGGIPCPWPFWLKNPNPFIRMGGICRIVLPLMNRRTCSGYTIMHS